MMTRGSRKLEVPSRLALPLVWLLAAWPAFAFDAIYAFGDSLTDTGNDPAPDTISGQSRSVQAHRVSFGSSGEPARGKTLSSPEPHAHRVPQVNSSLPPNPRPPPSFV